MYYTYFHTRNDTAKVFYVGKGKIKHKRAYDMGRNPHWNAIVAKHGHTVHIAAHWETEEEAFEHEKFLILCFKDMGIALTNYTLGGDGVSGLKHSSKTRAQMSLCKLNHSVSFETRQKMSFANTQRSFESRQKTAKSLIGNKNALGYKHTQEELSKMSASKLGNKNLQGYIASAETREKLRKSSLGNSHGLGSKRSDETKLKISEAIKRQWLSRKS